MIAWWQKHNYKPQYGPLVKIPLRLRQQRMPYSPPASSTGESLTNWWGDTPPPKDDNTFRLLYQNVNGLSALSNYSTTHSIAEYAVSQLHANMICFTETNLDCYYSIGEAQDTVKRILHRHWEKSVTVMSSNSENPHETPTPYLPGGTLTAVGQPWSNRATTTVDSTRDMGRWSEITLQGKEKKRVTFITAYRACKTTGSNTAWTQQFNYLLAHRNKSDRKKNILPDPRAQILKDLGDRIQTLRSQGHAVVLSIDANDSLVEVNKSFAQWVGTTGLIDILAHRHGTLDEPATYARGSKRIDYVFTSVDLVPYVTACGIFPLKHFNGSDHRGIFADFDLAKYLEGIPSFSEAQSKRGIQSSNPKAISMYRALLTEFLDTTTIEDDVAHISKQVEHDNAPPLSSSALLSIDQLDQLFTSARLNIEKKCSRVASVTWSPHFQAASLRHNYWKLWLSEVLLDEDFSHARNDIAGRIFPLSGRGYLTADHSFDHVTERPQLAEVKLQLKKAYAALKEVTEHDAQLRKDHLQERADLAAQEGNGDVVKAIERIQRNEQRIRQFNRLKKMRNKSKNGGLNHLLVPDEATGAITTVNDMDTVNSLLLERNEQHFSQADGTPFTTSPLRDMFGKYGTNQISELLLSRELDVDALEDISEATRSILRQLKRVVTKDTISQRITADDVRRGYKVWRETTCTSPSGVHLGHDKVLFRMETGEFEPKSTGTLKRPPMLSERIFELKAQFLNIAIQSGHVYTRWQTIINIMLEKIAGRPLIHKLRVIHLIESDFNLLIGILWGRRLMQQAESAHAFGEEQGGSRKDRKAQDVLLFKHLTYSMSRMTRTSLVTFDNDAKSCYDRIVMPLASLCSQRLGMPSKACELFLRTLDKAVYKIRTSLGTSHTGYHTNSQRTIHGPGQGGRGSPAVWTIVSCLAMDCMRQQLAGASFFNPDGSFSISRIMTGFVDDTTNWSNRFLEELDNDPDIHELVRIATESAQLWEELLHTTGGKLALEKCFFYLTMWKFDDAGACSVVLGHQPSPSIQITDSETRLTIPIEFKESNASHRTLGVLEQPDGNYSDEHKRLCTKSHEFARAVLTTCMNRHEADLLYHTMYLPSMSYSLAVGTLTKEKASKLQSRATQAFLSAMGYCSTSPLAVVYGPKAIGGIGLRHLFSEQGTQKVMLLLQQIRLNNSVGKLLQTTLNWAQHISGYSSSILTATARDIPHLQHEAWILTLREFLCESELSIHLPSLTLLKLQRTNDVSIMDLCYNSHHTYTDTDTEIRYISRCRTYLRVDTLSDICNAQGTHITDAAWNCVAEGRASWSPPRQWPRQTRPGPDPIQCWQTILSKLAPYRKLRTPLGPWLKHSGPKVAWSAYYDPTADALLQQLPGDNSWRSKPLLQSTRRGRVMSLLSSQIPPTSVIPSSNMIPADLHTSSQGQSLAVWDSRPSPAIPCRPIASTPSTWSEYITSLPPWEHQLLQHTKFIDHKGLQSAIENQEIHLVAVSDGGYNNDTGTGSFGWVLSADQITVAEGQGQAQGPWTHTELRLTENWRG